MRRRSIGVRCSPEGLGRGTLVAMRSTDIPPDHMTALDPFGVKQLRHTLTADGEIDRICLYMRETPSSERLLTLARYAKATWSSVEISIVGVRDAATGYLPELWATDWTKRWAGLGMLPKLAEHYGVPIDALAGL